MTQLEQMKEQPSLQGKDLNTQMNNLWLQSLKLTPEMIELSDAEIQELATYLKANQLIVACKKAAIRINQSTWKS